MVRTSRAATASGRVGPKNPKELGHLAAEVIDTMIR